MAIHKKFIHNEGRLVVRPIIRSGTEFFSTTVKNHLSKDKPTIVINGNFYDLSRSGMVQAFAGHNPIDATNTTPLGRVILNGVTVAGTSAPQDFYLAFDQSAAFDHSDLTLVASSGKGDPPSTKNTVAFGGLGPIIIGGLPYGTSNLYASGAPKEAPQTGEPPAAAKKFLTRRSSAKYSAFMARDKSTSGTLGKTCVGINEKNVIIYVQENGTSGMTLDQIRDEFIGHKCKHAVFFDGSDSSMLATGGGIVVGQGEDKDETCTVGVSFSWYPNK